jgi:hypothetical protein
MQPLRITSWRRPRQAVLLAALFCVPAVGCGAGLGQVNGTVRCNGKPLPSGTIQFLGSDGVPVSAAIQPDGTFSALVPVGQAKVMVSCVDEARLKPAASRPAASNARKTTPPAPGAKISLIPQRYADWEASGLTVLVATDRTVQDFNLQSK